MAPTEGDVAMIPMAPSARCSHAVVYSSCFWNRLNTLPVVQSTIRGTMELYSTSKEKNALVGKGLGYLEYGVGVASNPVIKAASNIADKYPVATNTAAKLDALACQCLDTIEKTVPAIHKPPTQMVRDAKKGASTAVNSGMRMVRDAKKGASTAVHSGMRKVLKTYPGQQVVRGLDTMITWSETTLDKYEGPQEDQPDQADKPSKTPPQPETEVWRDIPSWASIQAIISSIYTRTYPHPSLYLKTIYDRQLIFQILGMSKFISLDPAKLYYTLANGLIIPVQVYLQVLKMVRHMLASASGVKLRQFSTSSPRKSTSSSPRKPAHVLARRKVSPKKRLAKQGLVSRVTGGAMDMLEWSKRLVSPVDAKERVTEGCVNKRKLEREEDSDESWDSDCDTMNLLTALDQYHSCEDSDYCPAEPSDDSMEYNSGDHAESDLESEEAGLGKRGETLKQLRDKEQGKHSPSKQPVSTHVDPQHHDGN